MVGSGTIRRTRSTRRIRTSFAEVDVEEEDDTGDGGRDPPPDNDDGEEDRIDKVEDGEDDNSGDAVATGWDWRWELRDCNIIKGFQR